MAIANLPAKAVLADVLGAILDLLIEKGRVELRGFGVFEVRQRAARAGRNPKTGEHIDVPATHWVAFSAGKECILRLNESLLAFPDSSNEEPGLQIPKSVEE